MSGSKFHFFQFSLRLQAGSDLVMWCDGMSVISQAVSRAEHVFLIRVLNCVSEPGLGQATVTTVLQSCVYLNVNIFNKNTQSVLFDPLSPITGNLKRKLFVILIKNTQRNVIIVAGLT